MKSLLVYLLIPSLSCGTVWQSEGSLISAANITSADPVTWTTTATLENGNIAVCAIASDNDGNGTDTDDFVSVTYGGQAMFGSNSENEYDNGAAAAGAVVDLAVMKSTATRAAGSTISVDMSAARTAHAISCWEFSICSPCFTGGFSSTNEDVSGDAGAITGILALEYFRPHHYLFIRAIASETTNAAIGTPTAGWSVFVSSTGSSGTEATSMGIAAEFIITGSTSAISDPTMADTSADRASAIANSSNVIILRGDFTTIQ